VEETLPSKLSRQNPDGTRVPIRVLIVEDETDARESLAAVLGCDGAEVREAEDVPAALRVLDAWQPDVMIVDIYLPGKSGYDFMRSVRARAGLRAVPAIALTGVATVSDRITALSAGFTTHLTKPVEPATIVAAIASLACGPDAAPTSTPADVDRATGRPNR